MPRSSRFWRSSTIFAIFLLLPKPVPAQAVPSDAPAAGAVIEPHQPDRAMAILGCAVHDPDGKVIGRLIDVLVDSAGQPSAAVIDFGGFLGVGSRKVAVAWNAL